MDTSSPFLVIPPTCEARWRLIEDVLAQWFPAGAGSKVPSGTGPPAPPETSCAALQEWFDVVRRQPGIWGRQDVLFSAHSYNLATDFLIIGSENQSNAYWGVRRTELSLDDPPVYLNLQADGQWILENSAVSEFAVTWLAASIKWSGHNLCWANGAATTSALRIATGRYSHLGLRDWHWPEFPTRFYGTADLLLEVNGDDDNIWFWLSTRTKEAYREFLSLVGDEAQWEASSEEWPDGWVSSSSDAR
jgi:hypothetical protein